MSDVLVAVAGAAGPPASCNCPSFPSSADTQYHLSKYLDNWIWAGSRSGHYNQWHCQQCHWEPASSPRRRGGGTEVNVFSASWPDRQGDHKSPGWKILSAGQRAWGGEGRRGAVNVYSCMSCKSAKNILVLLQKKKKKEKRQSVPFHCHNLKTQSNKHLGIRALKSNASLWSHVWQLSQSLHMILHFLHSYNTWSKSRVDIILNQVKRVVPPPDQGNKGCL